MNRKHEQLPVPCFHDDDELLAPTIACREAPSCGASALPAIEKGVISINILPFEILRQVIVHARDAHLEHVVFQGQFHLTDTLCRVSPRQSWRLMLAIDCLLIPLLATRDAHIEVWLKSAESGKTSLKSYIVASSWSTIAESQNVPLLPCLAILEQG